MNNDLTRFFARYKLPTFAFREPNKILLDSTDMSFFSKAFSFCLIFYFLLLSWQPCQDFVNENQLHIAKQTERTITKTSGETTEKDDCSPFCACSCCRISIISYHFSLLENQKLSAEAQNFPSDFYETPYLQNDLNGIWRPPRI